MVLQYSAIARNNTILVSHQIGEGNFEGISEDMLKNISPDTNRKISYTSERFLFHVVVDDELIYLCVAEKEFGLNQPFLYLEVIISRFKQTALVSRSITARKHEFDRDFGFVMAREMERYSSGKGDDQVSKLRSQVQEVKGIMTENIEKVLERGDKLDDLLIKTQDLEESSVAFVKTSRRLHRKMWCRNMRMWIIIIVIVTIILTLIILFATGVIPTHSVQPS